MKHMEHAKLREVVFSKETCDQIKAELDGLEEARWFHRTQTYGQPTEGIRSADYYFLGDRQQPRDFNARIRALAPVYPGMELQEACVNRYLPGNYLPEHIDVHMFRKNLVIALCEEGDGIEIEKIFYPDVKGEGVAFGVRSVPHKVPAVKKLRYVLIYLYD